MTTYALESPPNPPGSLTAPPAPGQVLAFLDELRRWCGQLTAALDALDRRAEVASTPDSFTADLQLAMSLSESIDRRTDELIASWDSGRVGPDELTAIAALIWGRLPDALGNPTAFTLSEATTLAAALESRLDARLDADTIAGSGAADRIAPLRETLERCRQLVGTLGTAAGHADAEADRLATELERTLDGVTGPAATGSTITRIANAAELLERDLIKEVGLRSVVQRTAGELGQRVDALERVEGQVRGTAARCRDKIAAPPRLAVPEVSVLGPVPTTPTTPDDPQAWHSAAAAQTAYAARLDQVSAALAEAGRRFAAPLAERQELRGYAQAYQARAAAAGRAEDRQLYQAFDALRAVLWRAPCDLAAGRELVTTYVALVQQAVGAVRAVPEPPVPTAPPDRMQPQPDGPSEGSAT